MDITIVLFLFYFFLINFFIKVKGQHLYIIYTATYMNMTSSGLQCEGAYWPAYYIHIYILYILYYYYYY